LEIIQHSGFKELIVSFEEFIDLIRPENKKKLGQHIDSANHKLIFRGQSDSEHELLPSLFRDTFEYSYFSGKFGDLCFLQFSFLKRFVAGCDLNAVPVPNDSYEFRKKYLDEFPDKVVFDSSTWPNQALYELLALAQHYGYPTDLLDWSYSSLIAGYFAASGVIEKNLDLNKSMSIWVFDLEKKNILNSHNKINFEVIDVPRSLNLNISSQQGCFTLVRQNISRNSSLSYSGKRIKEVKLLTDLMAEKQQNGLLKLTLSNKHAVELIEFCESYSINAASLFRGPYGAARYAVESINLNRFAANNEQSVGGVMPL
jgi:hypothetical protein